MSISLCMIVKNEEESLPRCLNSVKDIVDEMVIVDTGSTDATVNIARSYGARVYQFEWNDNFSDARNYSLKFAACDWILMMDADDELDSSQKDEVVQLAKSEDVEAYFFQTICYLGTAPGHDAVNNLNVRLIKNKKGYFFSGAIHEQIYSNIKAINPEAVIENKPIKVYHYGYLSQCIAEKDKRRRNIRILEKEIEKYPGYGFALFNLGNEYFALGDNLKALEYYQKAYDRFEPAQGFSSKLVLRLAYCFIYLGRYEDTLRVLDEGLRYYPDFTDLVHLKGLLFSQIQRYTLAIRQFEKSIEMGEPPIYLSVIIGCGTYRSYLLLGEIYQALEDYDMAVDSYTKSLEFKKGFTPAWMGLLKSLCAQKLGTKDLKQRIEQLRGLHPEQFEAIVYDILIQERYYDLALDYLQICEKQSGKKPSITYYKGLCKLYLKKYRSVCSFMRQLKDDPEYAPKAVCAEVLCRLLEGKYQQAYKLFEQSAAFANHEMIKVYYEFANLMDSGNGSVLSEDEKESTVYTVIIFDLLRILAELKEFKIFEKALHLLNLISDKTVLLQLAKLYYKQNCYGLAKDELLRSIKIFDLMDEEGARILYRLFSRGF